VDTIFEKIDLSNWIPYYPEWREYLLVTILFGVFVFLAFAIFLPIIGLLKNRKRKLDAFTRTTGNDNNEIEIKTTTEEKSNKISLGFIFTLVGIALLISVYVLIVIYEPFKLNFLHWINPILILAMILIFSTVLIKKIKEQKITYLIISFATFCMLLVIAIAGFPTYSAITPDLVVFNRPYSIAILLFFGSQIPIMVSRESFTDYFGLSKLNEKNENHSNINISLKRINFVFYIIICLAISSVLYGPIIEQLDENGIITLSFGYYERYVYLIGVLVILFIWFNFTFLRAKETHRIFSFFIGLLMPVSLVALFSVYEFLGGPWFTLPFTFEWPLITSTTDILISTGFYAFFFFLNGMAMSANTKKKDFLIIYGLHAVTWLVLILVIGIRFNNFEHSHLGSKFLAIVILQIPLVFIVMFLGALYGQFIKKQLNELKTTAAST
jgi:hypothetical protein